MAKDFAELNRLEHEAGIQAPEAGRKQELVTKFVKAWENETARRAVKGGTGLSMALTLAACGGSSGGGGFAFAPSTQGDDNAAPAPGDVQTADIPPLGDANSIQLGTSVGQTVTGTDGNDVFVAGAPVNDLGGVQTTLTALTTIDGGAGDSDVLNIVANVPVGGFIGGPANPTFPAGASVTGVEVVNVYYASNFGIDGTFADASNYDGVTELWQINFAANVTNLGEATTAGFRDVDASSATLTVAASGASAAIAADNVTEDGNTEVVVTGADLTGVTLSEVGDGLVAAVDGNNVDSIQLSIDGSDAATATTFTLNTAVDVELGGNVIDFEADNASVTTLDASGSTGDVFIGETLQRIDTVTTGSGDDDVSFDTAGMTVSTGAGSDTVGVIGRAIASTDTIDGGANGADAVFGGDAVLLTVDQDFTNAVEADALSGVSNVEVLGVVDAIVTVDQSLVTQSQFAVADIGAGASVLNVTGASSGVEAFAFLGTAVADNTVDVTMAGTGTADEVNIGLVGQNDGGNQAAFATVTTSGAETVNVTSYARPDEITGDAFTGTNQVALNAGAANEDVAYVLSGAGKLTVAAGVGIGFGTGSSVNAAALAGDLTISAAAGLLEITGGTGDDEITALTAAAFDLDGGAGSDTLVAAADMTAGTFAGFETLDSTGGPSNYKASQLDGLSIDVAAGSDLEINTADSIDQTTIDLSGLVFADATDTMTVDLTVNVATIGNAAARTFTGTNAADNVTGAAGIDTISTGAGNDIVDGAAGADVIDGGAGADIITGGTGADAMTGGAGADRFFFAAGDSTEAARDTIADFSAVADVSVADTLDLTSTTVTADVAAAGAFDVSAATTAAGDTITATVTDGIITLGGADAAAVNTLAEWIDAAEIVISANEVGAFEFNGNTYVLEEGAAATANVIELTGLTGVEAIETGALNAAANTVLIA